MSEAGVLTVISNLTVYIPIVFINDITAPMYNYCLIIRLRALPVVLTHTETSEAARGRAYLASSAYARRYKGAHVLRRQVRAPGEILYGIAFS